MGLAEILLLITNIILNATHYYSHVTIYVMQWASNQTCWSKHICPEELMLIWRR